MSKELDLDKVLVEIGMLGRFQITSYVLILIPIVFSAFHISQYIFVAASVPYRCKVPECEAHPPKFETNGWGIWALPDLAGRCERYLPVGTTCTPSSFHPTNTTQCESWVYENNNTVVSTFNLACEEWKRTFIGAVHSMGLFFALPLTAYISDNFGRRIAFISTAVAPAFIGVGRSFAQDYITYLILEFVEAVTCAGVYSSGFILVLEMIQLERRVLAGNIISCTFAVGQAISALVAWAIPEWRTLTRVLYAPSIVFLLYFFFIEESIRWLLSKGKKKEAARIFFKAASMNKKKLSPETIRQLTEDSNPKPDNSKSSNEAQKKSSLAMQVLKSKVLMTRLCICSFWWIAVTFIYYGLSINAVSLAGNSYVNYVLTALVEIPGYIISVFTLDRFGRKWSIMTAFIVCGISLLSLAFIPHEFKIMFAMLGKLTISMVFGSVYIYTVELFPTPARHSMMSVCSVIGRLGSTAAPLTPLLMTYMDALPYILFGVMALTSGLLMMLTPETINMKLPDTVKQAEDISVTRRKSITID